MGAAVRSVTPTKEHGAGTKFVKRAGLVRFRRGAIQQQDDALRTAECEKPGKECRPAGGDKADDAARRHAAQVRRLGNQSRAAIEIADRRHRSRRDRDRRVRCAAHALGKCVEDVVVSDRRVSAVS